MAVITESTVIKDVQIVEPAMFKDERGFFIETYRRQWFPLGRNCKVEHSEMEHSVVLDGSSIIGIARLTDSLIGRDVAVTRSEQKPRALRLMLGDDSKVELE